MKKTLIVAIGVIVIGVVLLSIGYLVVAQANHHLKYFALGEDPSSWREKKDLGYYSEIIGAVIAIVGLALLVLNMIRHQTLPQAGQEKGG